MDSISIERCISSRFFGRKTERIEGEADIPILMLLLSVLEDARVVICPVW